MAYYQARSGVCRAGVTYAGWSPPLVKIYINGVDKTSSCQYGDWSITDHADGTPATLSFIVDGFTPTVGNDVTVLYATPNEYIFGGTLLQIEATPFDPDTALVQWHCTAVGYPWLMDRYDLVLKQYDNVAVNSMVADILGTYTDGGFKLGIIPSSLGYLTMTFTYERVRDAFNRIAKATNAYWEVTHDKRINMFTVGNAPEAALPTLTAAKTVVGSLNYRKDGTQWRTREIFQGQGSTASAQAGAGTSTVSVDDTSPFLDAGGTAVSGRSQFTYTGRSTSSGPGNLTGCSGIVYDIEQGDAVDLIIITSDSSAASALASALGGGMSGQATNYLQDGRVSATEASGRNTADLAFFGTPLEDLNFTYTPTATPRHLSVGRALTVSMTASSTVPITISGSFTIQTLTTTTRGTVGGVNAHFARQVSASRYVRTLTDLLQQLPG